MKFDTTESVKAVFLMLAHRTTWFCQVKSAYYVAALYTDIQITCQNCITASLYLR